MHTYILSSSAIIFFMRVRLLDKHVLLTLSGWFTNLSAGWFGSIFILPVFFDTKPMLLLTVHLPAAILSFVLAVWFSKEGDF